MSSDIRGIGGANPRRRKLIVANDCGINGKLRIHFYLDVGSFLSLSLLHYIEKKKQCYFKNGNVWMRALFSDPIHYVRRVVREDSLIFLRSSRNDRNTVSKSVRSNEFFAYRANAL